MLIDMNLNIKIKRTIIIKKKKIRIFKKPSRKQDITGETKKQKKKNRKEDNFLIAQTKKLAIGTKKIMRN